MLAIELVDLAALVALNSQPLVRENPRMVNDVIHSYWSASRCRLDRWGRGLRSAEQTLPLNSHLPREVSQLWHEILVAEIPTRMVAALFTAHDQFHQYEGVAPIGRNVLYGHIDARRRALWQIQTARKKEQLPNSDFTQLFARCSRWNDLLLGYILRHAPVGEFAFDIDRAREFSFDSESLTSEMVTNDVAVTFLRGSLRMGLTITEEQDGYSSDLNQQIAAAVMACFGPELFDSFGLLKSSWLRRMESMTDDTIALVENLMDKDLARSRWQC
jgi:hypothetical protein